MTSNLRNPYFDYSRAICLAMVCWFHFSMLQTDRPNDYLLSLAGYALTFFFVLSGYLIHLQLSQGPLNGASIKKFYWNRSLRIFPAYYLVLLLAIGLVGVPYLPWFFSYTVNIKLFLISLDPTQIKEYMSHWHAKGIHYWSMGIEEQFYILYPLFLLVLPRKVRLLGITSLAVIFWILHWMLIKKWPNSYYGTLLPVCGQSILIGAATAELKLLNWLPTFKNQTFAFFGLMLLSILALGISPIPELNQFRPPLWTPIIVVTMALFINSLGECSASRWANLAPLKLVAYLGRISYGVYLIHLFWLGFFYFQFSGSIQKFPNLYFLGFFIFAVLQGILLWELVEKRVNSGRNKIK